MRSAKQLLFFPLLLIMLIITGIGHAQNYTVSLLGKNDLRKANYFYKKKNYEEASKLYTSYLTRKPNHQKAQVALANSLKCLYLPVESETWYRKALSNTNAAFPEYAKLDFAEVLIMNGKINEAHDGVKVYLEQNPTDERAKQLLSETAQYPSFYKDSLQYSIQPSSVNSEYADYAPVYYIGGIVFCSSRPSDGIIKRVESSTEHSLSHLYVSTGPSHNIDKFSAFYDPSRHNGPITFWNNYTQAIYCSNSIEQHDRLALFYSSYDKDTKAWSKPVSLSFINSHYSYAHPSYDQATQTLYFASTMEGGYGGSDLYRVTGDGTAWSTPVNIGSAVNTSGDEVYPFLSKDNVLYFSSNGHTGMGGHDVYSYTADSSLQRPVANLGYPVNGPFDDFSLIVSDSSSTGLFASNRNGNDDIYAVRIYKIKLELEITDQLNYKPLSKTIVKVMDTETGELKYVLNTDKSGRAVCSLIPGKNYHLKVYRNGYAMKSVDFVQNDREQSLARKHIAISRIHQRYIKAKVMQDTSFVKNCEIRLMDYSSDSILSFKSDSSGYFLCQINSDTTALLYIKKDSLQGYALFEKDNDNRENSGITYLTINLDHKRIVNNYSGQFKNEQGTPIANETFYFKSRITNQVYTVQSDEQGAFSLALEPYGIYDLYNKPDQSTPIGSIHPTERTNLEIITVQ